MGADIDGGERNAAETNRVRAAHSLWPLGIGFVIGLSAHVGGYALQSTLPTGFPGLLGDCLPRSVDLLWTRAVVAVFVQIIPEVKRRQIRQALDDYEAARREKAKAAGDREGKAENDHLSGQ